MVALVIGSILVPLIGMVFGALSLKKRKRQAIVLLAVSLTVVLVELVALVAFTKPHNDDDAESISSNTSQGMPAYNAPKYITLGGITSNLIAEQCTERYIQLGIVLKTFDTNTEQSIRASEPEIRDKIFTLLQSKKATEVSTEEGKTKLAGEISFLVEGIIGTGSISENSNATPSTTPKKEPVDVFFTSFIIQ